MQFERELLGDFLKMPPSHGGGHLSGFKSLFPQRKKHPIADAVRYSLTEDAGFDGSLLRKL